MAILPRMLPSLTEHNIAFEYKDKRKRLLFVKNIHIIHGQNYLIFRILLTATDWNF